VIWQTIIYGLFVLSAIGIACVERLNQMVMAQARH
jgi:hypothetical protein